jgi:hypothetical protein
MLFTDGVVSSVEYLAKQDSRLLDVADVEDIDVTVKIALAEEEIAVDLESMLRGVRWLDQPFWCRPRPDTDNIVVTPALKLWHTYRTIEMVYEDAFFSQLDDRFKAKRDQFHEKARAARERLIDTGVAIVWNPVSQADLPFVGPIPGTSLPDGTYYVTVSWVNKDGGEGAPAVATSITTSGSLFLVTPGSAPESAAGWNVFVGTAPETMCLQNASVIAPGAAWAQRNIPETGRGPGNGQLPDYVQPIPRVIRRG